jgi:hypothetical protein
VPSALATLASVETDGSVLSFSKLGILALVHLDDGCHFFLREAACLPYLLDAFTDAHSLGL